MGEGLHDVWFVKNNISLPVVPHELYQHGMRIHAECFSMSHVPVAMHAVMSCAMVFNNIKYRTCFFYRFCSLLTQTVSSLTIIVVNVLQYHTVNCVRRLHGQEVVSQTVVLYHTPLTICSTVSCWSIIWPSRTFLWSDHTHAAVVTLECHNFLHQRCVLTCLEFSAKWSISFRCLLPWLVL